MLSTVLKILALGVFVVALFYLGTCTYANFFAKNETAAPETPALNEAVYTIYIKNTGNLYYANEVTTHGDEAGKRVYVLEQGYWELRGNEFVLIPRVMVLNEDIYGEIVLRRR